MANQLTPIERDVLAQMLYANRSKADISRTLGRPPSTIWRELHRNSTGKRYMANEAQGMSERRRCQGRAKSCKMNRPELRKFVLRGLRQYWSPDQIAHRLAIEFPDNPRLRISHQSIYTWLSNDDHCQYWKRYLRRFKTRKRRKPSARAEAAGIANRPEIINNRERPGDWEGDTIVSAGRDPAALVTLVERQTGYAEIIPVPCRKSKPVRKAMARRLGKIPRHLRQSVTFDQGSEFADFQALAKATKVDVYFTDPHAPWQKGTNENTNGLIRQFAPKGTHFSLLDRREVRRIQRLLNNRPRKRLGYQTPREVFYKLCYRAFQT